MEEEKAAAYYDELTRKGEGAARFKQGLGYSTHPSSDTTPLVKNTSDSSSFLSNFVPASAPGSAAAVEIHKQIQIENIQNKLKKKPSVDDTRSDRNLRDLGLSRGSSSREDDESRRHRSPSREDRRRRSRERNGRDSRRRHRSSSREDERVIRSRDRDGNNSRRRSSSRERRKRSVSSSEEASGYRRMDGSGSERRRRRRRRSRSLSSSEGEKVDKKNYRGRSGSGRERRSTDLSPRPERFEKRRGDSPDRYKVEGKNQGVKTNAGSKDRNTDVDYSRLIRGYAQMTPSERVKAKMKLQITEIAVKDTRNGSTKDWERFDFNKEAPLDEVEVEAAEDDAALLQGMGRSFRLSAVEANREAAIQAAHDQAIFGASSASPIQDVIEESNKENNKENELGKNLNLISEKVFAMQQQGSWRDRARKLQDGSKN